MSSRGKEAREFIRKTLEELQVPGPWEFGITGNSHQDVKFDYHGRRIRYVFPGSHSDHRALKNARCGLRRILRETAVSRESMMA